MSVGVPEAAIPLGRIWGRVSKLMLRILWLSVGAVYPAGYDITIVSIARTASGGG